MKTIETVLKRIISHVEMTKENGPNTMEGKTRGATTRDGGNTWDETGWTYDPASGLNTAKRYADGSQIAYAYTDNGKKTRTTWARGVWKENAYDSDNRVSGVTYSDGTPTEAYAYSAAGKVSEASVAGCAQYVYGYDSRLLCTNESVTLGAERIDVVRTYDDRSRCDLFAVEVTNVAHAVKTRRFDAYGRAVGYGITNACGRGMTASLQYTGSRADGITYTLPNGGMFASTFTRSPYRPDLVTRRDYRFGTGSIYWYETGYDLAGRPTNAVDSVSLARAYLYNRRNELAEALVGTNAFAYAYDTIGNRTSDTFNGASRNYAANCLNQYIQVDAAQMVYDADGNLVRDDRFAYAYDAENRLVSVRPIASSEGDLAVVNAYDHKHRRVMKRVEQFDGDVWQTSETHTFAYDGCNIVLERIAFADGSTRTVEYFWGNDLSGLEQGAGGVGGLLAVSIDGSFYFPSYDHNGNVVCYVSETGTIAAQYVYDPYGNVIDQYGTLADVFDIRFSTHYTDRETGLLSYKRRFYRPEHGRWLNRDPIEEKGGANLYVFCLNRAIDNFDPIGLKTCCRDGKSRSCDDFYKWSGSVTVVSVSTYVGATFLIVDLVSNYHCNSCSRYRLHAKAVLINVSLGLAVSLTGSDVKFGDFKPDAFAGSVSLASAGLGAMGVVEASYLSLGSATSKSFGLVGGAEAGISAGHGWYVDYDMTEE